MNGRNRASIALAALALFACEHVADQQKRGRDLLNAALDQDFSNFEKPDDQVIADPFEPVNRKIYAFNTWLDRRLLEPTSTAYGRFVPAPARTSTRAFVDNLKGPVWLTNDLLQGEWDRAGQTATRFTLNTTLGVAGLYDFADRVAGIPKHDEDFGQTLGSYDIGNGPYLMLPILGPSTTRDAFGRVVDTVIDPTNLIQPNDALGYRLGLLTADTIDIRYQTAPAIDAVADAADPYAQVRSLYVQARNGSIRNGNDDYDDLPDFD